MLEKVLKEDNPGHGLARPQEAADFLVHHMLETAAKQAGLHIFVTHDCLITLTVSRLNQGISLKTDQPDYLEAIFFWRNDNYISMRYRHYMRDDIALGSPTIVSPTSF